MFAPEGPYRHVRTLAGKGSGPAEFASALRGIAVDARGAVYAAGDSEVKLFDPAGRLERRWSTARPGLSVAVAPGGSVWVGETGQIEIFESGKLRDTWRDEKLLARVTSIAFSAGKVFTADAEARAIRRFDGSRKFLNDIGKDNPTNGLLIPNGVVDFGVDARGVIYAANPGKHRVELYSSEGRLLGRIGRFTGPDPSGFTGCCNPTNVAVLERRGVFVTEKADPRARLFDFSGKLLAAIDGALFHPMCRNMDIAVDGGGRVLVADTEKLHVLVFAGGPS
ncbi:MAG: NHL repeat-containing protein [Bryobacteraceae bacterium]